MMRTRIYPVAPNILRCTVGERENPFSFVPPERKIPMKDGICEKAIDYSLGKDACIEYKSKDGEPLFAQAGVSFEPVDVIACSTKGEAPDIETISTVDGSRTRIRNLYEYKKRESFRAEVIFKLDKDDAIFGLGQDEEGLYNKRDRLIYLYQHNMRIPMPVWISCKGYGVVIDASCLMVFDDTKEETRLVLDTVDCLDYYVIAGTPGEVIAGYRYLTGKASMLPKWAFGYMQSKERYKTDAELLDVAKRYRESGIPIDCVIQDWKTWEGDLWGEKILDKSRFSQLKETVDALRAMHIHVMISIWPNMNRGGENHREFAESGLLLGDYSTYDAFDKRARQMYWEQMNRELVPAGVDAWWCDSTEPFSAPDWGGYPKRSEKERFELVGGEHKKYLDASAANAYSLRHAQGIYENQRNMDPDRRVLNLTRSGYAGIQQYGVVLWAGDTSASWPELKKEIAKGLSICMSGIPYWTVDTGAFFAGGTACWRKWRGDENADPVWFWAGEYDRGIEDEEYKELYVRWLQFSAFLPVFRSHGTDTPREIWNFGKPGDKYYDAIEETIKLRYLLMPYIYAWAARTALRDDTMMRSLLFDFSYDKKALQIDDEFMFGESILVCPVLEAREKKTARSCYLPEGCGWYDFWTGDKHGGGETVDKETCLERIPLFVREGSIIPVIPGLEYATQKEDEIELRIFPGKDARFLFYHDAGDGYGYEKDEFETIEFSWEEKQRRLDIRRTGGNLCGKYTFTGHLDEKKIRIEFEKEPVSVRF